jgi:hypothetical protein
MAFDKERRKRKKIRTGNSSKLGQEALSCSGKGLESRASPRRLRTGMGHTDGNGA